MPILRVAIDVPADTLFDYTAEEGGPEDIGCRVLVPFGRRTVIGVIVEVHEASSLPRDKLRPAIRVLRGEPALTPRDLELLAFAADYYRHPIGQVVMDALPARLRRASARAARAPLRYVLTAEGRSHAEASPFRRARAKSLLLERLTQGPL